MGAHVHDVHVSKKIKCENPFPNWKPITKISYIELDIIVSRLVIFYNVNADNFFITKFEYIFILYIVQLLSYPKQKANVVIFLSNFGCQQRKYKIN